MRRTFAYLDGGPGRYDVCIVGGGPAGVTLATRLAERGRRVLLLEAGGLEFSDISQDVYQGRVEGDPYFGLDTTRLRFFGGTSNHWAGWCRAHDAYTFVPKPRFPHAHWPIRKTDLDPYAEATQAILKIAPGPEPLVSAKHGIRQFGFMFSPPVRFGPDYLPEIEASARIDLVLDANVTGFETDGARVQALQVQDYAGGTTRAVADRFVLATGGIENSRLLLWGQAQTNGALVDARAPIGRYWMEHPHFTLGAALIATAPEEREYFELTAEAQAELEVLSCGLRRHRTSREHTAALLADLACAAPDLAWDAAEKVRRGEVCGVTLRAAWEQVPRFANRVALSATERDRFGIPRPVLHWTKTDEDLRTARLTAERYGAYLADSGQGRVRLARWVREGGPWPADDELAGKHHMGGTRMSDGPETGVVDRDARVWGQENLYVAGSSLFPAGGHANPTYTIVQLALRLAEHLAA